MENLLNKKIISLLEDSNPEVRTLIFLRLPKPKSIILACLLNPK